MSDTDARLQALEQRLAQAEARILALEQRIRAIEDGQFTQGTTR